MLARPLVCLLSVAPLLGGCGDRGAVPAVARPAGLVIGEHWPLGDGDVWFFGAGLHVVAERTAAEPNLGGDPVVKVSWNRAGESRGLYLDASGGGLAMLGEFDAGRRPTFQDVFGVPAPLFAERDPVGVERESMTVVTGFAPYAATLAGYDGIAVVTATVLGIADVDTPLGRFPDTVHVRIDTFVSSTLPALRDDSVELWLAHRVGPVQLRVDGALLPLTGGFVGGAAIAVP